MHIIAHETRKVWSNHIFTIALIALLFINLILVFTELGSSFSQTDNAPSYRIFTRNTANMSLEEKGNYIRSHYEKINGVVVIENIQRKIALEGNGVAAQLSEEYADVIEAYYNAYSTRDYLVFTNNINDEYHFINSIWLEYQQVGGYQEFLKQIQTKAENLQSISIFADSKNDFDSQNIQKTAADFAILDYIVPEFHPQKGLRIALGYFMTDFILLTLMLFLAFSLVRGEIDTGLIYLIHTTPRGRLTSAFAKILVLAGSLLLITVIFYGTNLVYCSIRYGIGNLQAPIQSFEFLMRSPLSCSLQEYILLFLLTKWISLFVLGLWVLLACMLTRTASTGYLLAMLFPIASEAIRLIVQPLSRYNLLRYANIASILQTNEILGDYRNINIFGKPVHLFILESIAAVSFLVLFGLLFCIKFCRWQIRAKQSSRKLGNWTPLRKQTQPPTRWQQEAYKIFIVNGGAAIMVLFIALQAFMAYNTESYIDAEEIYYRNYMAVLEGKYTPEKAAWLKEEYKIFQPLFIVEQQFAKGEISQESYNSLMDAYRSLQEKYNVFQRIIEKTKSINSGVSPKVCKCQSPW